MGNDGVAHVEFGVGEPRCTGYRDIAVPREALSDVEYFPAEERSRYWVGHMFRDAVGRGKGVVLETVVDLVGSVEGI